MSPKFNNKRQIRNLPGFLGGGEEAVGQWLCKAYICLFKLWIVGKLREAINVLTRGKKSIPLFTRSSLNSDVIKYSVIRQKVIFFISFETDPADLQKGVTESLKRGRLTFSSTISLRSSHVYQASYLYMKIARGCLYKVVFLYEKVQTIFTMVCPFVSFFLSNNSNAGMCNLISHITEL